MKSPSSISNSKGLLSIAIVIGAAIAIQAYLTREYYLEPQVAKARNLARRPVDVLYLSDSTNFFASTLDSRKDRVSEFLAERLTDLNVDYIDDGGYNIGVHLDYIRYFVNHGKLPRFVILPINMEGFSPSYENNPRYQFIKQRWTLRYGIPFATAYRPLKVFKFPFDSLDRERVFPLVPETTETDAVRIHVERLYLHPLEEQRQRLAMLSTFASEVKSAGSEPVFFILPIDFDSGESVFGHKFHDVVSSNIARVKSNLGRLGVNVLDLSHDLKSDCFQWQEAGPLMNPHMSQCGREYVADQVAKQINYLRQK